ncbi:MAG: glycosyltransferase family 9 protein [Chitinophagaceae bacterium]|nr:glycosyltransferase family 9 protein [Chitinophagaceae bacterium]
MMPIPRKILIIRRDNIGDLVCTTPAIEALRTHFPNAEIGALVNSYNAGVLYGNPHLDRVFVYQKLKHAGSSAGRFKALIQRIGLIAQLRCWRPDTTILAKAGYDRHGLNLARQIGAKNVIGFVPETLEMLKSSPDVRLATPGFAGCHEVEAVAQLLAPLGVTSAVGSLQVFPDARVVGQFARCLPKAQTRIALHISAREPERRWGANNFIALIQHILQMYPDAQILLFWSPGKVDDPCHPGDDNAAAHLISSVRSARLVPVPTQNLKELIAALSLCDLFIGTDGGAMHLAVGLNKKILALFENQSDKLSHWYPWRVTNKIVCSQDPYDLTVGRISQAQVLGALASLL